jgi:hypothetical protein
MGFQQVILSYRVPVVILVTFSLPVRLVVGQVGKDNFQRLAQPMFGP